MRGLILLLILCLPGPAWLRADEDPGGGPAAASTLTPDPGEEAGAANPPVDGTAVPEDAAPAPEEAQGPPAAPGATTEEPQAAPAESRTEVTVDRKDQLDATLMVGGPLGAGVGLTLLHGLGADVKEGEERVHAICAVPAEHCAGGFLLGVSAGTGGGKLSLGLGASARIETEDFRGRAGAALTAAFVRTWGSPLGTEPGLSHLGPELSLSLFRFGLDLGLLWRLPGGHGGHAVLFSWGLSLRLS